MEVIKSNKGGEKVCLDGYMYVVHKTCTDSIRWKCSKRSSLKCPGTLITTLDKNNPRISVEHNHLSDITEILVTQAVQQMKRRARDTLARPVQLYAETVATLNDESRSRMPSEDAAKRTIRNHKRNKLPGTPNTLQELVIEGDWCTIGEPNMDRFLLHDSGQNSVDRTVIFADDESLRLLAASHVWYMDGNFALAPPLFAQLYVIRVPIREFFITAVYCLLQRKSQETYEYVLRTILDECANRNIFPEPTTIHIDFEKGVMNAVKSVLGEDTDINGCFYHLCQNTHRKIQSLGLEPTYRENGPLAQFCGMLDGLAFLPLADVPRGMDYLKENTPAVAEDLLTYFDQTYVTGTFRRQPNGIGIIRMRNLPAAYPPKTWNVHVSTLTGADRTNNQTEGWNNRFSNLVGMQHPSIWTLIIKMRQELAADKTKVLQNQAGVVINKKKRPQYEIMQSRLKKLCEDYRDGIRDIPDFLRAISHNIRQRTCLET